MDTDTSTTDEQLDTAGADHGDGPQAPADAEPVASGDNGGAADDTLMQSLEAQSGGLKDLTEDEPEAVTDRDAVEAIRDRNSARGMTDQAKTSALDWFLHEDPKAMDTETRTVELNFGTQDQERMIPWTYRPVPMEVMRAIRRKAAGTRIARQTGEVDEYRVNLEIVVEGTVDPDLKAAAAQLAQEKRGPGDPVDALRAKFQHKPGYIAQLAGRIMTISGFNDEDVRDAERAAKN